MIHFSYNLNDLIFRLLVPICLNLVGVYYFLVGDVVKLRYLECKLELANEMTTRLIRSGLDVCPYRPSNGRSRLLALGIFCQSTEVLKEWGSRPQASRVANHGKELLSWSSEPPVNRAENYLKFFSILSYI